MGGVDATLSKTLNRWNFSGGLRFDYTTRYFEFYGSAFANRISNLITAYVSGNTNDYELQSAYNHIDFTEDYSEQFDRHDIEHQVPFCWSRLQLYGILMKLLKEMKTGNLSLTLQIMTAELLTNHSHLATTYFSKTIPTGLRFASVSSGICGKTSRY